MSKSQNQKTPPAVRVTDRFAQHLLQQTQVLTELYEPRYRCYSMWNQVVRSVAIILTGGFFCADFLGLNDFQQEKIIIGFVCFLCAWGSESILGKKANFLSALIEKVKVLEGLSKHLYLSLLNTGVTKNIRSQYHLLDMWLLHIKGNDHKAMIRVPSSEELEKCQRNAEKIINGWIDVNERG